MGLCLMVKADYYNVIKSINISPKLIFSHDVTGTTPTPINLFIENRKAMTINMNFAYGSLNMDLGYKFYFGGGGANLLYDRDFAYINLKYSI